MAQRPFLGSWRGRAILAVAGIAVLAFGASRIFREGAPPPSANADELVSEVMAFDRNHDGALTPDELSDHFQSLFDRADVNHDGRLTPDELIGPATQVAQVQLGYRGRPRRRD